MPILAGVIAKRAPGPAMRRSQAMASATPAPKQGPSIAAMVGIGRRAARRARRASPRGRRRAPSIGREAGKSARSAPAQKASRVPARISSRAPALRGLAAAGAASAAQPCDRNGVARLGPVEAEAGDGAVEGRGRTSARFGGAARLCRQKKSRPRGRRGRLSGSHGAGSGGGAGPWANVGKPARAPLRLVAVPAARSVPRRKSCGLRWLKLR